MLFIEFVTNFATNASNVTNSYAYFIVYYDLITGI